MSYDYILFSFIFSTVKPNMKKSFFLVFFFSNTFQVPNGAYISMGSSYTSKLVSKPLTSIEFKKNNIYIIVAYESLYIYIYIVEQNEINIQT